jgi:hypothetical protein
MSEQDKTQISELSVDQLENVVGGRVDARLAGAGNALCCGEADAAGPYGPMARPPTGGRLPHYDGSGLPIPSHFKA